MTKNKKIAVLISGICTLSMVANVPAEILKAEENSYSMTVSINLDGEKKEISPYIYGVNEYSNTNQLRDLKVNAVRQGGNRYTGYNWETNYSNAGEDWVNSSDDHYGTPEDKSANAVREFSATCSEYNVSYKMTTLQMAGYVAADMNGTVIEEEAAPSARWKEVKFRKDGELSLEPDLTDDYVYMDEYVNYIVQTLGDSTTSTGIQGYSLDNEPVLWNDTHPRIHGEEVTSKELISKSIELANVVKDIDANAEVFGGVFWGMLPCIQIGESGNGFTDSDWQAVKSDYNWYLDYYLDQMADAEQEYGKRLLDVIDVHYYAQDCADDDARLQAARSLYDADYVENSWLQPYMGQYFPFLPNIQKSIDTYYPGTKIAVSEYNLANIADEKNTGKSVVSAIAEAEALGCFADNNVYLATYWGTLSECPYVASAINLYTNYDGEGATFGDTLVEAKTEDVSLATAYASIQGEDDSNLTMVVSNKDKTRSEKAEIALSGTETAYKSAVVYAITQDNDEIHIIDVQNDLSGNTLTVELPPLSVAQVVLSTENSDKQIYVAPDITTKEVTYKLDELEISENGYPMIPIEDAKALKKVVIRSNASCTSGASWYGGGGGLCFNHLKDTSGTEFWGQKSFTYNGGVSDNTVVFDGFFTNVDADEVEATIGDTYMEFQDWWKSSANDETGADVSVVYESITVCYEYDNSQPQETTESTEVTETSEMPDDVMLGDVNEDGAVDILDIILVNRALLGKEVLSESQIKAGDVDKSGKVAPEDSLTIMKYIVGLLNSLV